MAKMTKKEIQTNAESMTENVFLSFLPAVKDTNTNYRSKRSKSLTLVETGDDIMPGSLPLSAPFSASVPRLSTSSPRQRFFGGDSGNIYSPDPSSTQNFRLSPPLPVVLVTSPQDVTSKYHSSTDLNDQTGSKDLETECSFSEKSVDRRPSCQVHVQFDSCMTELTSTSSVPSRVPYKDTTKKQSSRKASSEVVAQVPVLSNIERKYSGEQATGAALSYFSYIGSSQVRTLLPCPSIGSNSTTSSWRDIRSPSFVSLATESSSASFMSEGLSLGGTYSASSNEDELEEGCGDTYINVCTCMCCVNAMFYHCTKDVDEHWGGNACSCEGTVHACAKRWFFLSLLTCCMPCLIFYPPLKGCQKAFQRMRTFYRERLRRRKQE